LFTIFTNTAFIRIDIFPAFISLPCTLHEILSEWSSQGGWDGRGM